MTGALPEATRVACPHVGATSPQLGARFPNREGRIVRPQRTLWELLPPPPAAYILPHAARGPAHPRPPAQRRPRRADPRVRRPHTRVAAPRSGARARRCALVHGPAREQSPT